MAYKIGIVGMGKMAEEHAKWIIENANLGLAAICEKNKERNKEIKDKYEVPVFNEINKFLKEDLDIVVVTTTNEVHEPITIQALESGRNVIVEKPMALNYESAKRMVEAAEKNKKQIFLHLSCRWDRDFLFIKEIIDSGILGDILSIQARVMLCDEFWPSWGIDGMKNPWRTKAAYGGGMIYDWGPHMVDEVIQLVKKDPIGVYGITQSGLWTTEVDDHFFSILRFGDNMICQIEVSNNGRINTPRWYIIGKKGTLMVPGKSEPFWDEIIINYIKDNGKKEIEKVKLVGVKESGLEGGFYEDLVPHLEGKKKEFVSMYDGLKVTKILDLIKKSSEENRYLEYKMG